MSSKVIGIDLGTTNSCVAIFEREGPKVLASKAGQPTTPSVVAVADSGKRLVGHLAKRQAITNPTNTIYGAKRLIGRRYDSADVQRTQEMVSFGIVRGPHDDARVVMADKPYAVPEVSSMVLQEMRAVAERFLGDDVSEAVVTVPAYFNDNQRQATKDAGRIAGLEVLRIINEPTAAALAYGFGRGLEQKVVIYDLGGGTFDISVLEIGQGVFEVLATAGDSFLGGEDFDERVIDWLVDGFRAEYDIDLRQDKMALQRLRDAAEKAKVELSSVREVDINLPFIFSTESTGALHLQRQLTRDQLETLVDDLIQRTVGICRACAERAQVQPEDLGGVILVGGMTRMPRVQQVVQEIFGLQPSRGVHPDEVVAMGAAIQGHLLSSGSGDTLLLDVTPHDLGIMVAGGLFDVLIDRDTTIPTVARKTFTTVRDGQTQVRILVLQGESSRAEDNELLGEFLLDGLRQAPRGEVKIEVIFEISADGIVGVSACDLETGHQQAITVTASSGLTEQEIRDMIAENKEVALASEASDAFEEARTECERLIRDIHQLLPEARNIIHDTDFGVDAVRKAEEAVVRARQAIERRDVAYLVSGRPALERTVSFLRSVIKKLGQ